MHSVICCTKKQLIFLIFANSFCPARLHFQFTAFCSCVYQHVLKFGYWPNSLLSCFMIFDLFRKIHEITLPPDLDRVQIFMGSCSLQVRSFVQICPPIVSISMWTAEKGIWKVNFARWMLIEDNPLKFWPMDKIFLHWLRIFVKAHFVWKGLRQELK